MAVLDASIRPYSVRDFLYWQKTKTLEMNPDFQRRPHWKSAAKSYLLDTLLRGYPIPPVFIREKALVSEIEPSREVVDGQQRLRTIISYIAPNTLVDYDANNDHVEISKKHYPSLAGVPFSKLSNDHRNQLLNYQIATHVLPVDTDDRRVLQIFARMNATGTKLNYQELRNAEFFGAFKNTSYELAYEQLDRWREWKIFTPSQIARMQEVETTSDLLIQIVRGVSGVSKGVLDSFYMTNDERFPYQKEVSRRFQAVMDAIDDLIGAELSTWEFHRKPLFYTLFGLIYDRMFGFNSSLGTKVRAQAIPKAWKSKLAAVDDKIAERRIPKEYADAFDQGTTDKGRRQRRLAYVKKELGVA